jgi:hypothetical protein
VIANERARGFPHGSEQAGEPRLTLNGGGGGGSEDEYNLWMSAWMWPFPPAGPLRLVYDWAALQIPEDSVTIDAGQLHSVRDDVIDIWSD